jgi:hypothetical protein
MMARAVKALADGSVEVMMADESTGARVARVVC